MPTVRANGIDVFYKTLGAGDPIVLVAGFACDHTIWLPVASLLTARHRVILLDNRGVGRTSSPDAAFSIRDMADDLAGLLDVLGLGAVHVVGHSMGGQIAQELALARPEQARSLTLVSSCARLDARGKTIIESWGDLPRQVDAATGARLSLPWVYTSGFFDRPGALEETINLIVTNPFPPSVQGIFRQSRAVSAFDSTNRLGAIACPTMVLVGGEDILLPVAFSEALAQGIRGAQLVVLPQAGHGLLIESAEEVTSTLLGFLSRQN